jgi:hypothetical protein
VLIGNKSGTVLDGVLVTVWMLFEAGQDVIDGRGSKGTEDSLDAVEMLSNSDVKGSR